MNPTPILPSRLDWSSAIGNFILNFGVLDWQILVFLDSRMSPDDFAEIKDEHFQDRIKHVKKLVAGGNRAKEQEQAFARFFERLDPIRQLRNHIAHGHMLIRVVGDKNTPVLTLSLPRDLNENYAPDTRHLEFVELTRAMSELTSLIDEFQTLSGGWRTETLAVGFASPTHKL